MKIKTVKSFVEGSTSIKRGSVMDVSPARAKELIDTGLAVSMGAGKTVRQPRANTKAATKGPFGKGRSGSRTGGAKPASSSGQGQAPGTPGSNNAGGQGSGS